MQIQGPAHLHGPQPINAPHRAAQPQPADPTTQHATVDQLDISREADLVSRIHDVPDIRADKVADIKAQIAAGTYETEDRMQAALDRLLDEMG